MQLSKNTSTGKIGNLFRTLIKITLFFARLKSRVKKSVNTYRASLKCSCKFVIPTAVIRNKSGFNLLPDYESHKLDRAEPSVRKGLRFGLKVFNF